MEDEKSQENIKEYNESSSLEFSGEEKAQSALVKHYRFIVLAAVLLIGVFVFVLLASLKKAPVVRTPPPDPENVLLATVGNNKIYRNNVRIIALEQYLNSSIDNEVIKRFLDVAVERKILDNEAMKKGIKIQTQETKAAYYNLLKDKVIEGQVLSIEESDISWWIPPVPDYEQKEEFVSQRNQQELMADAIELELKSGNDAFAVAKRVYEKYKIFQPILGFNGAIIGKLEGIPEATRILKYDSIDADKPFFKLLYSMKSGDIRKAIWPDGSGGAVIKVVSALKGERIDYKSWLDKQIKSSVKYNSMEVSKL